MRIALKEISGFIIASRVPNLIIIAYTQFTTAWFLMSQPKHQIVNLEFGILLLSTAMVGAAGYIINDYFDQKIDMINRPKKVVIGKGLRRRLAIFSHIALSLTAIFLGFLIDPLVGAIHIFSTGALWTYSGIVKKVLLLSTLTISFLTILTILIVMVFYRELNLLALVYAFFGCAAVFIRETLKDIISSKGEQVFGIQSVPIVWGIRGAKIIIYLVFLAGFTLLGLYLLAIQNWTVRIFFIGIIPFILWFMYQLYQADTLGHFKHLKTYVDMIILGGLISMCLV